MRTFEDNVVQARHESSHYIRELVEPFNCVVVITYNTTTQRLTNWWGFYGHPENWGAVELSRLAWKMADHSAADLKGQAENPTVRKHNIAPRRKIVLMNRPSPAILAGAGFGFPKRLWCCLEWMPPKHRLLGFHYLEDVDNDGQQFWLARLVLWALALRFSRDR